ncbi:MAG: T9SS type A sorting domain-containing protein [Saprospiraceae bacterium]|nr:T9SS type A sorting domain-containing protein [Saprospiraceae bacterium]
MMRLFTRFLSIVFCLSFLQINAQVTIDPQSLDVVVNENTMYTYNLVISNKGATDVEVYWVIEKGSDFPNSWKTTMCDAELCYNENFDKIDVRRPNILKANTNLLFKIYFDPSGLKASTTLQLKLYGDKDFKNLLAQTKANAAVIADNTVSSTNIKGQEDLLIYPNPTEQLYFIKNDASVNRVSLYNVLGKEIKTENHFRGASHDVSALNNGLYFVRLYDSKNKVLKTLRLNKK